MKKFISHGVKDSVHIDQTICCVNRPKIHDKSFTSSFPQLIGKEAANRLHMNLIDLNRNYSLDCFSLELQAFYAVAHHDVKELIVVHSDAFSLFNQSNDKFSIFFPDHNTDQTILNTAKETMNTMLNSVCTSALATAQKNNSIILEKLLQTESFVNAEKFNFKIPIFEFCISITPPAMEKMTTFGHSKAETTLV